MSSRRSALLKSDQLRPVSRIAKEFTVLPKSSYAPQTPKLIFYRYGIFVSVTTLFTIAMAITVPYLVRAYALDCYDPNCYDTSLGIVQSMNNAGGDPCEDFYGYVCGGWQRANPDTNNLFQGLQQRVAMAVIKGLILEDANGEKETPPGRKVAYMFQACAQLAFNEQDHIGELREFLGLYNLSWPTSSPRSKMETFDLLVSLSLDWGIPLLFHLSADTYFKQKGYRILHFSSNPYMTEWFLVRNTLIQKGSLLSYFDRASLILAGKTVSKDIVEKVLDLDNKVLSTVVPTVVDPRPDFDFQYVTFGELDDIMGPHMTSAEWLQVINNHLPEKLGPKDEMFVMNRRLLKLVGHLISRRDDLELLLPYVTWHLARHLAPLTSYSLSHAQFVGEPSSSTAAMSYMIGRCYVDADSSMPFAFAHIFLKRWLPQGTVDDVTSMLGKIRNVANSTMATLSWMDDETKRSALSKLATLRAIIGNPQLLSSEAALQRHYPYIPSLKGSYFTMMLAVHSAELAYTKSFLKNNGSSHTSEEVSVPLTLVNAFYVPIYHVMVIPAAIMYPPFYMPGFPVSYNFGSLGHVVGHEMTHAFDPDMGLYDSDGIRRNWWTPASHALFELRLNCLRELYNLLPWSAGINYGDHALSENFADCGGMLKVYRAFRSTTRNNVSLSGSLAKFTDDQLFFISSCFKWCSNEEKQSAGWYSPPRLRCNVPLMNMPQFAEAFDCGPDKAMNPTRRCDFM